MNKFLFYSSGTGNYLSNEGTDYKNKILPHFVDWTNFLESKLLWIRNARLTANFFLLLLFFVCIVQKSEEAQVYCLAADLIG